MIDIERLHKVHDGDERRRAGKSWYVYDGMLRLTQTDVKDKIVHVSNNQQTAYYHFNSFMDFLDEQNNNYDSGKNLTVLLNGISITFISNVNRKSYLEGRDVTIFEDIHDES